jgi:hypothetical protein
MTNESELPKAKQSGEGEAGAASERLSVERWLRSQAPLWIRTRLALAGLKLGFTWVHCNGESSHSSACLLSFHHPLSITWRWALYWIRPRGIGKFTCSRWRPPNDEMGSITFGLPFIGAFSLSWQAHLWR